MRNSAFEFQSTKHGSLEPGGRATGQPDPEDLLFDQSEPGRPPSEVFGDADGPTFVSDSGRHTAATPRPQEPRAAEVRTMPPRTATRSGSPNGSAPRARTARRARTQRQPARRGPWLLVATAAGAGSATWLVAGQPALGGIVLAAGALTAILWWRRSS
jgi:hypothetical protein